MLNRRHARADRRLDTGGPVRVRGNAPVELRRRLDDRAHLVFGVLLHAGRVSQRQHAAGRADLDDIGAVFDHVANRIADFVDSIGDARFDPAFVLEDLGLEAIGLVAVPAANAERDAGGDDPWSGNPAGVDGVAQRDVAEMRSAHDAYGRESGLERLLRVGRPQQRELARHLGESRVLPVAVAERPGRQVHVGVDEPGQHRGTRQIDHGGTGGDLHVRSHGGNAIALHQDHRVLHGRCAGAVDERAGADSDSGGGGRRGRGSGGGRRLKRSEGCEKREIHHHESFPLSLLRNPPDDAAELPLPPAVNASPNSIAVMNRSSGLV